MRRASASSKSEFVAVLSAGKVGARCKERRTRWQSADAALTGRGQVHRGKGNALDLSPTLAWQ